MKKCGPFIQWNITQPERGTQLAHFSTWVNLRNILLSERNHTQKATDYLIPRVCNAQNRQIHRHRKQMSGCQDLRGAGRQSSWLAGTKFLVAQMGKNRPAVQETQFPSLSQKDPLEKGMVTHSSILAWRGAWWATVHEFKMSRIQVKWKSLSHVWLCESINYTVQGILQARILEWVAYPFSRGSFWLRNRTGVSCIAGGFFTNWAIRKAQTSSPQLNLSQKCFCFFQISYPYWKWWSFHIVIHISSWSASWEICMQARKQQLELDMEQQTGFK